MGFTQHFGQNDYACKCGCGFGTRPSDVIDALPQLQEAIRLAIGRPIANRSGCRCEKRNTEVGGVSDSAHMRGSAADMTVVSGYERWELVVGAVVGALWLEGALKIQPHLAMRAARESLKGLGVAKGFVHIDVDEKLTSEGKRPAAWVYTVAQGG